MPKNKKYFPYGAPVPTSVKAHNVFMEDGTSVETEIDDIKDTLNKKFELIDTITVEEAVTIIDYTLPKAYSDLVIQVYTSDTATDTTAMGFRNEDNTLLINVSNAIVANAARYFSIFTDCTKGYNITMASTPSSSNTSAQNISHRYSSFIEQNTYTEIYFTFSNYTIPVGSIIKLYGIPA